MGRAIDGAASTAIAATGAAAACSHCGLPCAGADDYCCYGCEIAAELAREAARSESRTRSALTLSALLFMSVMMLSLFLYAEDVYGGGAMGGERVRWLFRVAAAVLCTPVVVLLGVPLVRRAVRAGRPTMDLLIATGAFAAYALSMVALMTGGPDVYFDTVCAALVLSTLGRYIESRARARASALIGPELRAAAEPVQARAPGGAWAMTAPAAIEPGMRLRVAEEQVLPVDAVVDDGQVEVDLAVLTGEPRPVTLRAGDEVPAGAVPCGGSLACTAVRAARASTLARLEQLARALRERRAPVQRTADRFAAVLVPVVWAAAIASFALWAAHAGAGRGVVVALAVVLAACPCTYGVATPLAMWLGLRTALRHGAVVRDAAALEQLARVRGVVFDKTGTLTDRALRVREVEAIGVAADEAVAAAAGLEGDSRHPIARAIAGEAARRGVAPAGIAERALHTGRGIAGRDEHGRALWIGSGADARAELSRDGVVIARFHIDEVVRPEAAEAVAALRRAGLSVAMATGDRGERAARVAAELGIAARDGLSPADKVGEVADRQVAMVGDGINDAPALAGAGPSFAVAGAAGLAHGVASVTLQRDDLRLVPWTIELARSALRTARTNLAWATTYNLVFVALAAAGALRPVFAALAMITSSIIVVGRALAVAAVPGPGDAA